MKINTFIDIIRGLLGFSLIVGYIIIANDYQFLLCLTLPVIVLYIAILPLIIINWD